MTLKPDLAMAQRFLDALGSPPWTFQTFDDKGQERSLARIFQGTLEAHGGDLEYLNNRGAGVFVCVNETDCRGRSATNVTWVRAVFVDQDTPNDTAAQLCIESPPHIVVRTSPERYHRYWRVNDCPLAWFSHVQEHLAKQFQSDPTIKDLPRVMRLPGFYHQKTRPFLCRLEQRNGHRPYSITDLMAAYSIPWPKKQQPKPRPQSDAIIETGERNVRLTAIAGMFRKAGCTPDEIVMGLAYINRRRVVPPLRDSELRAIARSIGRYAIAPIEELESETMSDMIPLGGLWKNKSQNGTEYLSGYLGEARVLIFKVRDKRNDNSPDYKMMLAPKKRDQEQQNSPPDPKPAEDYQPPAREEEIPF